MESAQLSEMVNYVKEKLSFSPVTAVVLGSGLGHFVNQVKTPIVISYTDIPYYPRPTVKGHAGQFVAGTIDNIPVILASGRFHYYEGHSVDTITLPQRLFYALGIKNLIITNAAGSLRKEFPPGSLMAIDGHLDCTFRKSVALPTVFRGEPYHSEHLSALAKEIAKQEKIELKYGVYAWTLGPSFETRAEIRMIREFGGDAVGMSTVPEILVASKLGLKTLGISCLTNYAAGITDKPLTHYEVIETATRVSDTFTKLLKGIITSI